MRLFVNWCSLLTFFTWSLLRGQRGVYIFWQTINLPIRSRIAMLVLQATCLIGMVLQLHVTHRTTTREPIHPAKHLGQEVPLVWCYLSSAVLGVRPSQEITTTNQKKTWNWSWTLIIYKALPISKYINSHWICPGSPSGKPPSWCCTLWGASLVGCDPGSMDWFAA